MGRIESNHVAVDEPSAGDEGVGERVEETALFVRREVVDRERGDDEVELVGRRRIVVGEGSLRDVGPVAERLQFTLGFGEHSLAVVHREDRALGKAGQ